MNGRCRQNHLGLWESECFDWQLEWHYVWHIGGVKTSAKYIKPKSKVNHIFIPKTLAILLFQLILFYQVLFINKKNNHYAYFFLFHRKIKTDNRPQYILSIVLSFLCSFSVVNTLIFIIHTYVMYILCMRKSVVFFSFNSCTIIFEVYKHNLLMNIACKNTFFILSYNTYYSHKSLLSK